MLRDRSDRSISLADSSLDEMLDGRLSALSRVVSPFRFKKNNNKDKKKTQPVDKEGWEAAAEAVMAC